uniref:Ubiquitin-like modifier-activating enzyme Atg7 N-terminal domain-containing protein n=1 Tax=Plectus sambesii TaxID=2011161 RepID=A0A914V8T1_9BILA
MAEETVKFVPFASFVDPAFWADLTDRKLRHWGLDDSAKLCVLAVCVQIALSVALGFDSFVIVRHGVGSQDDIAPIQSGNLVPGDQLGCYFCSDVTAPGNSTRDRTLDQQCTVTRPGVSQMAAGLAVELLAAVVQHPLGGLAPAALTTVEGEGMDGEGATGGGGCLGSTPHQIRGYVSRFSQMTPCVRRFQKCVACGTAVRRELAQRGWGFLRDAFDSPDTLETVSGLGELQVSANDIDLWEYSDNESVKSMDTVAEPS